MDRADRGEANDEKVIERLGLTAAIPSRLDSRFTDADGDLVADVPKDADSQLDPDVLVFSYVAGPNASEELATWQEFKEHLSRATGKPVETVAFASVSEQLQALASGKLHVSGFNTGAVTSAVTTCGFVPACTLGRDDGKFGSSMRFIVRADSPIKAVQNLKGRTVAFTLPDSNSGCRAAIVLLREYNLLPQRDYKWRFSGSHQESIKGVASGLYQTASVSDDLLQRALAAGDVESDAIRTIYESERFPPATIGYAYNLTPELADKIRQAFLDFSWKDTGLEKQFGASGATRFVPVSYKQDFALVRRVDDSFRHAAPPKMAP